MRATTASPALFDRIYIGNGILKQEFIDAGMGYNNPVKLVVHEAENMHPRRGAVEARKIDCIISIGTGQRERIKLDKKIYGTKEFPDHFHDIMKNILHDCESTHQTMANDSKVKGQSGFGVYFRLNVEQGLQEVSEMETKDLGQVIAQAEAYVHLIHLSFSADSMCFIRYREDVEVHEIITKAMTALTGREFATESHSTPQEWQGMFEPLPVRQVEQTQSQTQQQREQQQRPLQQPQTLQNFW